MKQPPRPAPNRPLLQAPKSALLPLLLLLGLGVPTPIQADNDHQLDGVVKPVRFRTDFGPLDAFQHYPDTGPQWRPYVNGYVQCQIRSQDRELAIQFGLKPKMLAAPSRQEVHRDGLTPSVDKIGELPTFYALSEPIRLTREEWKLATAAKEWPLPGQPPIPLQFTPAELAFQKKDIAAYYAVYFGLPLGLVFGMLLPLYVYKIYRPRQELLQVQLRREALQQSMNHERLTRKDNNMGAEFGHYFIDKFLGAGGMARVYRGVPSDTFDPDKCVAIKLMEDGGEGKESFRKRFLREAEVGKNLVHPSVVAVLDFGIAPDNTHYLILEFVKGETLRDKLLPTGMAGKLIWMYLKPVFEGLQYVHDREVIHRDLKPDNIMVEDSGKVKVMDFGLARRHDFSMLTGTGDILGTPAYMSPEQIKGEPKPGPPCDQYAMGVILYEMLTGQLHFPGVTDPVQLLMKNMAESPTPIRKIRPDLSEELETLLLRMLHKEPDKRFPSVSEAAKALEPLLIAVPNPK